jgi:O-antigen/teichoic acid export membrane protein
MFSAIERYGLLVLAIASGMVLARLLTPAETGVYSVAAVLLGMAQVLRDFGVGQYVVQAPKLNAATLRAVIAASFLFAWPLAALIALASSLAARFYDEPRLGLLLQLLAINFVLLPLSSTTLPMLRRQLRFASICTINLGSGIVGAACAISLAWLGMGYMSLAYASLAATASSVVLCMLLRPKELPWLPHWRGLSDIVRFGAYATGGTLVDEAGVAAPDLIIGKLVGMEGVGLFGKAMGVLAVFNQAITSVVSPVIFPLFAAKEREQQDLAAAYLLTVSFLTAFALPFFAFLAWQALPIVRLLYGSQWDSSVLLIQIMCCSSGIYSMFSMARYLFVAKGKVKEQARLDLLVVPAKILALLLAAPFGLTGMAWAVVAGSLFRSWITLRYLRQIAGIRLADLLLASRKSAVLAVVSVGLPALLGFQPDGRAAVLLLAALAGSLWVGAILVIRHPLHHELRVALGRPGNI